MSVLNSEKCLICNDFEAPFELLKAVINCDEAHNRCCGHVISFGLGKNYGILEISIYRKFQYIENFSISVTL